MASRAFSSLILALLLTSALFVSISSIMIPSGIANNLVVNLAPNNGKAGDVIIVTATNAGVAVGTVCTITDDSPAHNVVTSATASVSASTLVSGSFIVGNAPAPSGGGTYTISVKCPAAGTDNGQQTFTVTPKVTVSPPIGVAGQVITVTGVGFWSNAISIVDIINAPSVGGVETCSPISGASVPQFTCSFTVDSISAPALYTMTVDANIGSDGTGTFQKVTGPTIAVSPTSATPGYGTADGGVSVTGGGFATSASSRTCTITSTNGLLFASTTCSILTSGTVTGSFAVAPGATPSGGYNVRVTDTNPAGVFADTTFTVLTAPSLLAAAPPTGSPGASVTLNTATVFALQDVGPCTISSSPAGLISSPFCLINAGGGLAPGATFTVSSNAPGGNYIVTVTGIHGDSASTPFTVTVGPLILSPTIGSPPLGALPGTEVTITGAGFKPSGACTITVSPAPPPGFNLVIDSPTCTVSSSGVLTNTKFKIGALSTWGLAYSVKVTGPGADSATAFLAVTPRIALTPNTGAAGTSVTLSGSGFAGGGAVAACASFTSVPGGLGAAVPAPVCTRNPDGTVFGSFTVDAAAPQGGYTVIVAGLGADVATASFTVGAAPTLTLTPTIGSPAAGSLPATVVQLSGSGFNTADAGTCTVTVTPANPGLITSPTCTISSAGVLSGQFTVGPGTQGAFGWVITVKGSTNDFATAPFAVIPQIDLSPRSGPAGTVITMTGSGFNGADAGSCTGTGGGGSCPLFAFPNIGVITADSVTISGATFQLTGTFIVGAVPAGIYMITWQGTLGVTIAPIFTVTVPVISFSPASGSGGDEITVSGSGFSPADTGACAITTISGTETIESFTCTMTNGVVTGSFIVKTPGNSAGVKTIKVESISHGIATNTFKVVPKITLTPNPARVGSKVTVSGTNFNTAPCTISSNPAIPGATTACTVAADYTIVGDGSNYFTLPPATTTASSYDITVTDAASFSDSETLNIIPRVVTLTPLSGPSGTTVTVTGEGFSLTDTSCNIFWSSVIPGNIVGSCSIAGGTVTGTFNAPGPAGWGPADYTITVYGYEPGPTAADYGTANFLLTPSLSLAPTSGNPGTLVTLLGGNWLFADSGPCSITSSPSGLISNPTCNIAGGAMAGGFTVASGATGPYTVIVTGAGGTEAFAEFNTPPAPSLTLDPTSGPVGTSVTVSGSNFAGSTCLLTAVPGGLFITSSCSISGGTMSGGFTVGPGASTGSYTVNVQTNLAGDSATKIFNVTPTTTTTAATTTTKTTTATTTPTTTATATTTATPTTTIQTTSSVTSITTSVLSTSTTTNVVTSTAAYQLPKCIIATATFGSEASPAVQFLRNFRDHLVLRTSAGSAFMEVFNAWYYSFSPSVAKIISNNDPLRAPVRVFLYPLLGVLGASAFMYSLFDASPEFAVVVAGLVASSLIGVVYLTLPAIIGFRALTRRRIRITSITKASSVALAMALGLLVAGELTGLYLLLAVASSAVVLLCFVTVPAILALAMLRPNPK